MQRKNYKQLYKQWCNHDNLDPELKAQIAAMEGNEKEQEEAFYMDLEFGTAGMRGIISAGTNRMNIYTVRRAAAGLGKAIAESDSTALEKGIAIAYDTRNKSPLFARESARVLIAMGFKVYLFESHRSTPELSFAIRHLSAAGGIVITASHNPKEYNGFKAYGADGGQLPPDHTAIVTQVVNSFDIFTDVVVISDEQLDNSSLLNIIGENIDRAFLDAVKTQVIDQKAIDTLGDSFKLVYTPFHGTGYMPITRVLDEVGFKHVMVVPEQKDPDINFSTVKSPNPEDKAGFAYAIELAKQNDVDLIIGTDPDCDRVGVIVRDNRSEYRTLTGNQTGSLLCKYILDAKQKLGKLSPLSTVIKTIVTTPLADAIAKSYNAQIINVLTGFKYIGEKMTEFAQKGNGIYEIGFEESYGYLIGTHARDKDAVVASMLIAEMAASYKLQGKSLYDGLCDLYKEYGYYMEKTISLIMPGKDGLEKIASLMKSLGENPPKSFGEFNIERCDDYNSLITIYNDGKCEPLEGYPTSNVLSYKIDDGKTWIVVRPSGTEPKIKLYFGTNSPSEQESLEIIEKAVMAVQSVLGVPMNTDS